MSGLTSGSSSRNASGGSTPGGCTAYGRPFWLSYGANVSLMMAISLLFRYADFVKVLGGDELHLGWIVGVGVVGSLAMRVFQGVGIDKYGPRQVWLAALLLFSVTCLAHHWITRFDTPAIYVLRILYNTSIAAAFGAGITYISARAPVSRMAEVVGTLGTSGFVGMTLGAALGDFLCGTGDVLRFHIDRLFNGAALLGGCSLVLAALATAGQTRPRVRRQPGPLWLVRKYQPGAVLLVGVAMGIGLSLPGVFVRPFAAQLGIPGIALFFTIYPGTAFVVRMATRRWSQRIGVRPMILAGVSSLSLGMLAFLLVRQQWQLAAPAVLIGIAHALLFPNVIAGGSASFPARYRGLGTTLVLAMFDIGNLFGAPLVGGILRASARAGIPAYPTMFVCVAAILSVIGAVYAYASRGSRVTSLALPAKVSVQRVESETDTAKEPADVGA